MAERLPIRLTLALPTHDLYRVTFLTALAQYGPDSHHLADTLTPGHVVAICREFEEAWNAWNAWQANPTDDHAAHLREELAQLGALIQSACDTLGPNGHPPWWATQREEQ